MTNQISVFFFISIFCGRSMSQKYLISPNYAVYRSKSETKCSLCDFMGNIFFRKIDLICLEKAFSRQITLYTALKVRRNAHYAISWEIFFFEKLI